MWTGKSSISTFQTSAGYHLHNARSHSCSQKRVWLNHNSLKDLFTWADTAEAIIKHVCLTGRTTVGFCHSPSFCGFGVLQLNQSLHHGSQGHVSPHRLVVRLLSVWRWRTARKRSGRSCQWSFATWRGQNIATVYNIGASYDGIGLHHLFNKSIAINCIAELYDHSVSIYCTIHCTFHTYFILNQTFVPVKQWYGSN